MAVRIPWADDPNWFLLTWPAPLILYYRLLFKIITKSRWLPAFVRQPTVWVAFSSSLLVLGFKLELYHRQECPNSGAFHQQTEQVARDVYHVLDQLEIDYWLMFGNILFALRGQDGIPAKDTDSDVAVQFEQLGTEKLTQLTSRLQELNYNVWHPTGRDLIQVYVNPDHHRGPHIDIFLYRSVKQGKELENLDWTNTCKRVSTSDVFPLRPIEFLGSTVYLPHSSEKIAELEYGPSYMTPLTTRQECVENVWNGFCFFNDTDGLIQAVMFVAGMTTLVHLLLSRLFHHLSIPRDPMGLYLPVGTSPTRVKSDALNS